MLLDARTLLFSLSLLASTDGERAYGFKQWAMSAAGVGMALVLIFFRGQIPDLFGIVLANVILLFSACACLGAVCKFYEIAYPWRGSVGCVTFGLVGLALWWWGGVSLAVPTVTVCVALAALLFYAVWLIWRRAPRPLSFAVLMMMTTLGCMALMYCFRAVTTVWGSQPTTGEVNNSVSQLGVLIVGALFIVSASIGFLVMVHEHQRARIEELSRRDVLTGVLTRRAFFDAAQQVCASGRGHAVLMMDIDHFKAINDEFGHLGGDKVLAHCARALMNAMRLDDVLGRYGGEEFCAVLPGCQLQDAETVAHQIVAQASAQRVTLDAQRVGLYTLSVGLAVQQGQEDLSATMARADQALYAAKHAGRNCVRLAGDLV